MNVIDSETVQPSPTQSGNKSRYSLLSEKPALVILLFWFLLAWGGLCVWQAVEYESVVQMHKEHLVKLGQSCISVMEASFRSIGRGRREKPEFLGIILEEIIAVPEIKGAWLASLDGDLLAASGSAETLPLPSTELEFAWLRDGMIVWQEIDVSPCATGQGPGSKFSGQASPQPARLFLFIDRGAMDDEIHRDGRLRLGVAVFALVALSGVYLFIRSRIRSKRLQAELTLATERAHRSKEWALLGAGLAHETKNPLSVVRGLAQRLTEGGVDPARDSGLIVDEVDRIVARIDEFLQFSRPVTPSLTTVQLEALLNAMAGLIQADLAARTATITVNASPVAVSADENMLRQILLNVLVNAARSLAPGGRIDLTGRLADDGSVTIEVRDNGRGMPADDRDKIFLPYYTRSEGGTGLGLAIVKRLADAHDWRVAITSQEDRGTTVAITGIRRVLS